MLKLIVIKFLTLEMIQDHGLPFIKLSGGVYNRE